LEITLTRDAGIVSGYLSPVYLAPERSLGAGRWLWVMGDGVARTVALAVHLLMVFAITLVWLARRTDPIFGWLFLLGAGSLFNVITSSALMPQALQSLQPYVIRSEEHTSELQSREKLVCRPLLEKKTI